MLSQYFYAQANPKVTTGVSGFSVTVRTNEKKPAAAEQNLRQKADEAAAVIALKEVGEPALVGQAGIPDMQVVLRGGEIAAVFYRNAAEPPCVVVHDMDYEDDQEKVLQSLSDTLQDEGYVRCVHLANMPC